ncbi:MAG: metal-dependent hydrolase [Sandaracinus sp.]|nr:metal-dependent hydrolase [Sandaracinus sp.]MCB9634529.1 metal-dependent hydrolase [Sandaracinus sp.]
MDSFTQIVLGAAVAEAGFRPRLGRRATVFGGFCGLVPDLDLVVALVDPWADLVHHRAWSHALPIQLLAAPLFGWLGHRFGKREGTVLQWTHLAFWSLITHSLLDLFTSYGTQLWLPFTNRRYAWDGASIVDLVYTLPLVVALVLTRKRARPRLSFGVLAFTTAYLFLGTWSMSVARERGVQAMRAEGFEPEHVRALPTLLNNQLFRVVGRRGDDYRLVYVSHWNDAPLELVALRSDDDDEVRRVRATERGAIFEWFADGLVLARHDDEGVTLSDLRFGTPASPVSSLFAVRSVDGAPLERLPRPSMEPRRERDALWNALFGH